MANIKGRNVSVEVAASTGSQITMLSVAKALNATITAPGHALAEWSAATLQQVSGLRDLEGQAVIVNTPIDANSFHANGLDTRAYRGAGGSGFLVPVTSWLTLVECTSYELSESGGGTARLNTTTIQNAQARSRPGSLPQQSLSLALIPQTTPSAALLLLKAARLARTAVLLRITHRLDGSLRVCSGDPTFPTEAVSVGAIGTSSCVVAIDGLFLALAGIPPAPAPAPSPAPGPSPAPSPAPSGDYFSEDFFSGDYFG